jgi:hypothetical protein
VPHTERYGTTDVETLDIFAPHGARQLPVSSRSSYVKYDEKELRQG